MPKLLKNIILVFIILAGIAFFQLAALGQQAFKVIELGGLAIVIVFSIIHFVYDRNPGFKKHFFVPIVLIILGVILSMFMAFYAHEQPLSVTAIAQRSLYFYLFYFFLHSMRYDFKDLERIIYGFAIIYCLLFVLQFVVYPTIIFDIRIAEERGTLRIFLPGLSFLMMGYFLALNKILSDNKYIHLLFMVLFLGIFVLLGTRQILFTILLVTLVNIIFSGTIKSKFVLGFLATLALIPIFILFQEIFIEMINLSEKQAGNFGDDIRVRAATFFLTDFFPNEVAYITGNGAHSLNSKYGLFVEGLKDDKGYYQSDIGLIGEYTKYGVFFVIGVLLIFALVILKPYSKEGNFIRYFFIAALVVLPTSGQEFSIPASIIPKLIGLYLIDIAIYKNHYKQQEIND